MSKNKYIDLNTNSIFKAILSFMCLFVLQYALIVFANSFIKNKYLVYTIVYTLLGIFLFLKSKDDLVKAFKNIKKDIKNKLKNIVIVTIVLLIIEFILNFILIKIIGHQPPNNQIMVESFKGANILLIIYYMLIIGPIIESLIYYYPYHNVKNKLASYILYSLVFALMHMTATSNLLELLYIVPYLCMSFAFGYGFYKTNNIYVSIITHSINNVLAFMLLFIM